MSDTEAEAVAKDAFSRALKGTARKVSLIEVDVHGYTPGTYYTHVELPDGEWVNFFAPGDWTRFVEAKGYRTEPGPPKAMEGWRPGTRPTTDPR